MNSLPNTMVGAILTGPEQIDIREVDVDRPGMGEIILAVRAATTCGTDVKVFKRGGHPRMLRVPTLFGHEMAGTVAAIGDGVTAFKEGDAVVVANSAPCGVCDYCRRGRENLCEDLLYLNGAFAEYVRVPTRFVEHNIYALPTDLAFGKAALTEPLACVLHGMDACELPRYAHGSPAEVIVFGGGPIGLLFVGALAADGHQVILADPNQSRLDMGTALGAKKTIMIERGGDQADVVKAVTDDGQGAWIAVDATGVPEVWVDAIQTVRPGGLINLFGGCAPGTSIPLDTHLVHYSELTVKGVYHHRPNTVRRALELLSERSFQAELILSAEMPIERTEDALRAMIRKDVLKVVITGTKQVLNR